MRSAKGQSTRLKNRWYKQANSQLPRIPTALYGDSVAINGKTEVTGEWLGRRSIEANCKSLFVPLLPKAPLARTAQTEASPETSRTATWGSPCTSTRQVCLTILNEGLLPAPAYNETAYA